MRIFLTGANGFVGIEAFKQLVGAGHEVFAVDSLRYGQWRIGDTEAEGSSLLRLDLRERDKVRYAIRDFKPEAIIHLAAIHFIPECERLPHETVSTNVEATVNLLSACPEDCRFVFASTAAVYAPNLEAHKVGDTPQPMDIYGYSKLWGEQMVDYYSVQRGFQAVNIRLFNVVGQGETNPHIVPEIMKQLRQGKRTLRLGNISPKRDYVYVNDVARGFIAAATTPFPEGERLLTANLGTGSSYSVAELIERISAIIGEEITVETDPAKVRASDRPNLLADNSLMDRYFGWQPKTAIDGSLKATWLEAKGAEIPAEIGA